MNPLRTVDRDEPEKCHAKGCPRFLVEDERIVCKVCLIEMEVLIKEEMRKRLGRPPTEAEFDIVLTRASERSRP